LCHIQARMCLAIDDITKIDKCIHHALCLCFGLDLTFLLRGVIPDWVFLKHNARITKGAYDYEYFPHNTNYLIFFLPRRSRTVSLQVSCQYFPDSLSDSLAILSRSMMRSTCLCLAFVSGLYLACALSMMSNTLSMSGQVMSGTLGDFLRILDQ